MLWDVYQFGSCDRLVYFFTTVRRNLCCRPCFYVGWNGPRHFLNWDYRCSTLCVFVRLVIRSLHYLTVERGRKMGLLARLVRVQPDWLWRSCRFYICQWWQRWFECKWGKTVLCCAERAFDLRQWQAGLHLNLWLQRVAVGEGIYIHPVCNLPFRVHRG